MSLFVRTLARELTLLRRSAADVINPFVFFMIVITLFPLGLGPGHELLSTVAPAVIWIAALLAVLMSMDVMFRNDFLNGSLDLVVVSDRSLTTFVLAKILAHWLVSGLPLLLLVPVVGLVMFVDASTMQVMLIAVLLVTPTLSLLGAIGAALTVGLPRASLLVTLILLPIYVPVLILATSMVEAAAQGLGVMGYIYWLGAILLLALGFAPLATMASVRVAVER